MSGTDHRYDAIVLGVGGMGSATCDALTRRGLRVLGLEQHDIPHALGSSHGDTRIIRLVYFEHPDYVPLLQQSYDGWAELEARSGRTMVELTGGLYAGVADGMIIRGTLDAARTHGLPHEHLDHAELSRRFPQIRTPENYEAVWEPRAGFVRSELAISTYVEQALRAGATIHARERVLEWAPEGDGVTVTTAQGRYAAERLVICGGAWAGDLLAELGLPLTVSRQVLAWVWPRDPDAFTQGRMPVWAVDHPDDTLHYGFPMTAGRVGFKLGYHKPGARVAADSIDRDVHPQDEATYRNFLRTFMPDADGPVLSNAVCMYTNTPDGHFILDRHPEHPQVTFGCGFSGHGFKFAPVIGEVLADLAVDGETTRPAGFLEMRV